jgi:hypothetical protein
MDVEPGTSRKDLTAYLRGQLAGGELLKRSTINNVSILLTYRCPAACDHCLFESDNKRTETVDADVALRFIEAAARQVPPPSLSLSGGEAFLQLSLMKQLASFAYARGMISEVISSSAWCKTLDYTTEVLADLKDRGLRTYCTSVDRYHTPFVPAAKLRTGVLAALDVGLRVVLNRMVDPKSLGGEQEYWEATLDLPPATIERCRINPLLTTPVGRAIEKVNDISSSTRILGKAARSPPRSSRCRRTVSCIRVAAWSSANGRIVRSCSFKTLSQTRRSTKSSRSFTTSRMISSSGCFRRWDLTARCRKSRSASHCLSHAISSSAPASLPRVHP